ncbi:hypothetical protein KDA82_15250, partial [Streptomyces daliensis]|nr:hypothetical protein [Streptomyces daliensis]
MNLAAKCSTTIDFFGMFGDPIGEMIGVVAKLIINAAYGIFGEAANKQSYDEDVSTAISGQTRWVVIYLAVGSVLFAAAKMALDRRAESGQTALKGVLRVLLVSTMMSTAVIAVAQVVDDYSQYLYQDSMQKLQETLDCDDGFGNMLLLVVGCLLLLSAIIHILLMWIRLGVMILLMGTLPVAAAASMTDWGGTWWRKHLGWMIAWLLYKPTVALVIWSGSAMVSATGENGSVDTQIAGMGMLLLSAIALPALMRIIVPATEALGADNSGGATMAMAGGIASGAKALASAMVAPPLLSAPSASVAGTMILISAGRAMAESSSMPIPAIWVSTEPF